MKKSSKHICLILVLTMILAIMPTVSAQTTDYAYVRIEGYEETLVEKTAVPLEVFSLDEYGISDALNEYTALHAIIAALNANGYDASDKAVIDTNNGMFVSSVLGLKAEGNAGWMYVLNDESSWNSIKDQTISANDYIVLYYIEDWMACSYSTFGLSDDYETDAFGTVKLNLKHQVTDPVTWETSYENLSGASIYIDGENTDILTDENGDAYLTFTKWGTFDVSAAKYEDGINTISRPSASIKVYGRGVLVKIYTDKSEYSAYMDPKGFDLKEYNVSSELEFSALHAVIKALLINGFDAKDQSVNNFNKGSYISALAGIEALGNSSWMYTLNNESSWYALNEQPIKEGDLLEVYLLNDWMSDTYSYFDIKNISIQGGEKIKLRLYRQVMDYSTWEVTTEPYADNEIMINGKRSGLVTDSKGYVTLSFNEKGVYEISNTGKQQNVSYTNAYVTVQSDRTVNTDYFNDYSDVSDEYAEYMQKAIERFIISGDENLNIRADDKVTKAEFLTMVIRASELEVFGRYNKKYSDVLSGNWFSGYAQTVFKYGLAEHDNGYIYPNSDITDKDAELALNKAFGKNTSLTDEMLLVFNDGLTRQEAAYLIISYMENVNR